MIVFTKNVLCQLAEFPHVFRNSTSALIGLFIRSNDSRNKNDIKDDVKLYIFR